MAGEHAGMSILEMLWEQLENNYTDLKEATGRGERFRLMGVCAGLATAIAIMTNPYSPDEDAVRREIVERTS
jgi:hypothetical protein